LKTTPPKTLSIGPAFNIDVVMGKQGCVDCDSSITSKVTVNGGKYSDNVYKQDLFETTIEPVSGYMLNKKKAVSVFINFK